MKRRVRIHRMALRLKGVTRSRASEMVRGMRRDLAKRLEASVAFGSLPPARSHLAVVETPSVRLPRGATAGRAGQLISERILKAVELRLDESSQREY